MLLKVALKLLLTFNGPSSPVAAYDSDSFDQHGSDK
jgi:hypothetical protein